MGSVVTVSWEKVAQRVRSIANRDAYPLDEGQRRSLRWIAQRLSQHGVVLADEVGTGKTRIACAVMMAVIESGGRVAVVVPPGLMHQWIEEAKQILPDGPSPKVLRTLHLFLDEVSQAPQNSRDRQPDANAAEWWLISHRFEAPRVRSGSQWWRLAIPSLVRLAMEDEVPGVSDGEAVRRLRKRVARIANDRENVLDGLTRRAAGNISETERGQVLAQLRDLPLIRLRENADNARLLASFRAKDSVARRVTRRLLGYWLGPFDLVIIDEAHKGRSEFDHPDDEPESHRKDRSTILTRLVEGILRPAGDARRLCLTATPMELSLDQWLGLLARAGCKLDRNQGEQVTRLLHSASTRAVMAPDEILGLQSLCDASREFRRVMSPFVTRRRRSEEPLIQRFGQATNASAGQPHPHRRVRPLTVRWADVLAADDAWLRVLFAAEGMSQAACGLPEKVSGEWPDSIRKSYTRLAAGHVTADLIADEGKIIVPAEGTLDPAVRAKIARVAWWYERLRDARRRVASNSSFTSLPEFDPDTEHPRILAAVREIEHWTQAREKVLVFGVFLGPLHRLRDVLNARHTLRSLDAGRPLSHAMLGDARFLALTLRQWERMRTEGTLPGRLQYVVPEMARLRAAIKEAQGEYERLRDRVRRRAVHAVGAWRKEPDLLADATDEIEGAVVHHLVAFMIDDMLERGSETTATSNAKLDELAEGFAERRIRPLLRDLNTDDATDGAVAEIRGAKLRRAFCDEQEFRQSLHARLLEGSTPMETREHLQDAFNREHSSPRVLIAQSQVGREGLNLHEACRVVLQFHAEWNPAVLEQQIGRVDRKRSEWERRAQQWLDGGMKGEAPFIEVRQLICEGTYDAYQWERVASRQRLFDASLFGSLLPSDAWVRVPHEWAERLREAAPTFSP